MDKLMKQGQIAMECSASIPSITARFKRKKAVLTEELAQVNKALDLLEINPDLH